MNCYQKFNESEYLRASLVLPTDKPSINVNDTAITLDSLNCGFSAVTLSSVKNETISEEDSALNLQMITVYDNIISLSAEPVTLEYSDFAYFTVVVSGWWVSPKNVTLEVDLIELKGY